MPQADTNAAELVAEGEEDLTAGAAALALEAATATRGWEAVAAGRLWHNLASSMRRRRLGTASLLGHFSASDDGSGEVTYWEFFGGLRRLGLPYDDEDADLMMGALEDDTGAPRRGRVSLKAVSPRLAARLYGALPLDLTCITTLFLGHPITTLPRTD